MRDGSPRLWPYAPANSPLPLPDRALFTSSQDVTTLTADFEDLNLDAILSGSELAEHFAQFFIGQTPLNDHLKAQEVDLLSKRHPIHRAIKLGVAWRKKSIFCPSDTQFYCSVNWPIPIVCKTSISDHSPSFRAVFKMYAELGQMV